MDSGSEDSVSEGEHQAERDEIPEFEGKSL